MKLNIKLISNFALITILIISVITSWNCSNPKNAGKLNPNIRPKTRLSNVPPLDDTIKTANPRLSLNWVGDDPDGYVVGYKYTWSYKENGVVKDHPYKFILNMIVEKFALMVLADDEKQLPAVYKYFATLDPSKGLPVDQKDSLTIGDTITVAGLKVFASNPDYIRILSGERIKYSFPVHTNPNSGTFIFDSQDEWNLHTFQVSAIDNLGESSITPAMVSFETPQVVPPHTKVTEFPSDTSLVISGFTATYNGIRFGFQAIDPNSRTIEYRWVVDKDEWTKLGKEVPWSNFSPSEFAYVTAADFPDQYANKHTFYVQSKNEFGSIDTVGFFERITWNQTHDSIISRQIDSAYQTFYTIYPSFRINPTKKVLFINNSYYDARFPGTPVNPHWSTVDDYYVDMARKAGIQDSDMTFFRVSKFVFPSRGEISKYQAVIMYSDCADPYATWGDQNQFTISKQTIIKEYCYVGGNVMFSGWGSTFSFNTVTDEEFYDHIYHVNISKAQLLPKLDCLGVRGLRGYPDLTVDTTKLDTAWHGTLSKPTISGVMKNYPVGFGEAIHKYRSKNGYTFLEDVPLSLRYNGITFNMVLFGVPLYYMERPAADSAFSSALRDIKYFGAAK